MASMMMNRGSDVSADLALGKIVKGLDDASPIASMCMNIIYAMRFELAFASGLLLVWWVGGVAAASKVKNKDVALPRKACTLLPQSKDRDALQQAPKKQRMEKTPSLLKNHRESSDSDSKQTAVLDKSEIASLMVSMPSAENLRNASWMLPRLVQLSSANVQRAMEVYRAALEAGLDLRAMSSNGRDRLFTALVTSCLHAGGRVDEAMGLLEEFRDLGLGVPSSLLQSVVKLCTSKQLFKETLAIYDLIATAVPTMGLSDKVVLSCLLFCSVEARAYSRCIGFFERLQANAVPSQKDYWNMVRFCSIGKDWKLMLKTLQEMRKDNMEMDSFIFNTALATCVSAGKLHEASQLLFDMDSIPGCSDAITYNTLMKGQAKCGNMAECTKLFERMKVQNLTPSQVTYGILLDGFINDNQVEKAAEVFETLTKDGCPMNTILYTTLIKGFARDGKVSEAMRIYGLMMNDAVASPDLVTFSILLKSNCDHGNLDAALNLLGTMISMGLKPDEVIFNNVLSGCVGQSNVELAGRIYGDMVASGVRPSNATFSILIRVYSSCKLFEDASDLLRFDAIVHKVSLEPRLFSQLIQCCLRARQGRRAVEVYKMMLDQTTPSCDMHSPLIASCVKLNMLDTAVELLTLAGSKRARIDARDAMQVLDAAQRKQKIAVVKSCEAAMQVLGIDVRAA